MNPSTFLRTAATAIFLGGGAVAGCTSGTTSDLPGSDLPTNDDARDAGSSRDGTSPQTPQGLRASCGNGVREIGEDCDLGTQATAATYCSQRCKTRDLLAPAVSVVDGGSFARSLGAGRHPIASTANGYALAAIESGALVVLVYDAKGVAAGKITLDAASSPDADPSIAALPSGKYVVVWTDRAIDERDVAIAVVDPAALAVVGQVSHANAVTNASQFDADVVVVNGQVMVAWTDMSDAGLGPDVRYRIFDATTLAPATTTDQTLAATAAVEGSVTLAAVGATQWAATWRDGQSDGERLQARFGTTQWTVGPFVAGAAGNRPALVALDATHLLAVYGEGTDPGDSGVANTSNLRAVVLDAAVPSNIAPRWLSSGSNARDQPAAAMVGATPYVAWRSAAVPGDVNGEELWLQPLAWNGTTLDTTAPSMTLVRWPQHRAGDQRSPALTGATFAGGAVVTAWIDLGKTFGGSEGQGDVAFEIAPTPVVRGAGTPDDPPCPSGQRYCDSNCTSTSIDVTNCGNCGASCDAPPGATASCVAGECVVACSTGFHDCGGQCVSRASLATCGSSCVACSAPPANGTSTCDGTSCGFACNGGYANCGGGTCTNLGTDLANCGMCGFACGPVAHGTRACVAGTCAVNCSAGYHACGNSCADNASVNSCGGSCTPCTAPPNGAATCAAGQCGFACNAGFSACNGQCLDANDPVLNWVQVPARGRMTAFFSAVLA